MSAPRSHGLVATLLSPSGATAYTTTPRTTPAMAPMARVAAQSVIAAKSSRRWQARKRL